MIQDKFKYAICGLGPASAGLLFCAYRNGLLRDLIESGLLLIDASGAPGSGELRNYKVTANTTCATFLECIEYDPEGIFESFKDDNPVIEQLEENLNYPMDLNVIGEFLEAITDLLIKHAINLGARVMLGTRVKQIRYIDSTLIQLSVVDNNSQHERLYSCERLIRNIGAGHPLDRTYDYLKSQFKDSNIDRNTVTPGDEFLKFDSETINSILECADSILVIGSSHSAMSVIERVARLGPKKTKKITLLYRSKIRIFYPSIKAAHLDKYDFDIKTDVCPLTKGVNRYGGLRFSAREVGREILKTNHVNSKQIKVELQSAKAISQQTQNSVFRDADLVIPCLGYIPNSLPIIDNEGKALTLKSEGTGHKTTSLGQLISSEGIVLKNLFSFGIGAGQRVSKDIGGESSFTKRVDGVWLYHFDIGEKILDAFYQSDI